MSYKDTLIQTCEDNLEQLRLELSELTYYPEYDGEIVEKYVTCNRPNCICKRGFPHGPNKYYRYRKNNRWVELYIGKKNRDEYLPKVESNMKIRRLKKEIAQLEAELAYLRRGSGFADENS